MIAFGTGAAIPQCTSFITCKGEACFAAEDVRIDGSSAACLVAMCLSIIAGVCYSAGARQKIEAGLPSHEPLEQELELRDFDVETKSDAL